MAPEPIRPAAEEEEGWGEWIWSGAECTVTQLGSEDVLELPAMRCCVRQKSMGVRGSGVALLLPALPRAGVWVVAWLLLYRLARLCASSVKRICCSPASSVAGVCCSVAVRQSSS